MAKKTLISIQLIFFRAAMFWSKNWNFDKIDRYNRKRNIRYNDFGQNLLCCLKTMVAFSCSKDLKRAGYADCQSFIKNDNWDYQNASSDQAMWNSRWVWKIQKDRWDKILEIKAE